MPTKTITMYLHSSKEDNNWKAEDEGLEFANDDARDTFMYALYEVKFLVEVDLDTGDVEILTVDDKKIGS